MPLLERIIVQATLPAEQRHPKCIWECLKFCKDGSQTATIVFVQAGAARHAKAITVLNLKGGVGKTHTTWLLASVAHEQKLPILTVDLDTQGNLTTSFATEGRVEHSVAALFDPACDVDPPTLVKKTSFNCIDLIPSSPTLTRFDESNQKVWEKTDSHLALVDPAKTLCNRYRFIVFDCPPRLSLVSFAALLRQ